MSVIFITGASGFVGANVARHYVGRGDQVHVLLREQYRDWRLPEVTSCRRHVVDFLDARRLTELFETFRPRFVLHLAAYGAYESQADITVAVRTNLEAGIRLMECARQAGVERFVHTGSSSEYGYKDHAPSEAEAVRPNSLYAVTKAGVTHYGQFLGSQHGFHVTTLRLYSVYGPYEEPTRLIPRVIVFAKNGGYPSLVAPTTARDYIYVDDVVAAIDRALQADIPPGQIYNIGTGVQTSLAEVVALAAEVFSIQDAPVWGSMPQRQWDTDVWIANISRAEAELGWRPNVTFNDGFRNSVTWLTEDATRFRFYESVERSQHD